MSGTQLSFYVGVAESTCLSVTGLFLKSVFTKINIVSLLTCNQQALLQQRPNEDQPCTLRRSQSVTCEHDLGNLLDASGMNQKPFGVKRNSMILHRFTVRKLKTSFFEVH